jgi:hypothetical protein
MFAMVFAIFPTPHLQFRISQLPKTRVAAESESESDPSLTAGSPKLGTARPAAGSKRWSETFVAVRPAHNTRKFETDTLTMV